MDTFFSKLLVGLFTTAFVILVPYIITYFIIGSRYISSRKSKIIYIIFFILSWITFFFLRGFSGENPVPTLPPLVLWNSVGISMIHKKVDDKHKDTLKEFNKKLNKRIKKNGEEKVFDSLLNKYKNSTFKDFNVAEIQFFVAHYIDCGENIHIPQKANYKVITKIDKDNGYIHYRNKNGIYDVISSGINKDINYETNVYPNEGDSIVLWNAKLESIKNFDKQDSELNKDISPTLIDHSERIDSDFILHLYETLKNNKDDLRKSQILLLANDFINRAGNPIKVTNDSYYCAVFDNTKNIFNGVLVTNQRTSTIKLFNVLEDPSTTFEFKVSDGDEIYCIHCSINLIDDGKTENNTSNIKALYESLENGHQLSNDELSLLVLDFISRSKKFEYKNSGKYEVNFNQKKNVFNGVLICDEITKSIIMFRVLQTFGSKITIDVNENNSIYYYNASISKCEILTEEKPTGLDVKIRNLERLASLQESGALSDDEYEILKKEALK